MSGALRDARHPEKPLICAKYFSLNKKWLPYIIIILLAIAVFAIKKWQQKTEPGPKPKTTNNRKDPGSNPTNRDRGFDRRISFLQYSNHAKCRMQCRHISQAEVEQIMQDGEINYTKSDLKNARCPRYAVEGLTKDDQRVRIVYAQCNESTTVVTVIDLGTDWSCDCPGDDDKYKNKK
jgi:hypothetical protein